MKSIFFLVLTVSMTSIAVEAFADAPVCPPPQVLEVTGHGSSVKRCTDAGNYCANYDEFTDLEQRGVERRAEIDALKKCTADGYKNCVLASVKIDSCNTDKSTIGPGGFYEGALGCDASAIASGQK